MPPPYPGAVPGPLSAEPNLASVDDLVGAVPMDREVDRRELERELTTMAFYVAIVVEAELIALWAADEPGGAPPTHGAELVALIWGTTIGLALAHLFAFQLAARGRAAPAERDEQRWRRFRWELGLAQVAGAAAVAAFCTIPVLIGEDASGLQRAIWAPEVIIAVAGYLSSRTSGRGRLPSAVIGVGAALLALVVAVLKNRLGH